VSTTAWPEGVIARYLTVGGATVDIRAELAFDQDGDTECDYAAQCTGCHAVERASDGARVGDQDKIRREFLALAHPRGRGVRRWAQAHAEKCRAMPKPDAK
jgi:hypothetical protein